MATEQEKQTALATIRDKAMIADRAGLKATAQSWRELFRNVMARPAAEIIMVRKPDQ